MDVAAALDKLIPAAVYTGSLTANTQEAYAAIQWGDERPKPSWTELSAVVIEPPLADVLEGIFLDGIRQFAAIVPASVRGQLFILKAAGVEALKAGDIEATKALIEEAPLPQDAQVEAIRAEMLGRFPS